MERISRKAFDVYVCFIRNPVIFAFAEEICWFSNEDTSLFAVILFDYIDKDYSAVFLKRDQHKKVKFVDNKVSFVGIEEAEAWISHMEERVNNGEFQLVCDDDNKAGVDLFQLHVDKTKLHSYFRTLNEHPAHSAAKRLISEITPHFKDVDGNFVEQFQTSGFNSRLWELYLFCYFNEEGLKINREYEAPDFMLSNGDLSVAVEAVISDVNTPYLEIDERRMSNINVNEATENRLPLMYGSSLGRKLKHTTKDKGLHYWQHTHTKNIPFVIAIADFHDVFAMNIRACL